jgi:hypothetical protein
MEQIDSKPKIKIQHDTVIRLLREHAEMVRLLESFPIEITELDLWIRRKNNTMDKVIKKIVPK